VDCVHTPWSASLNRNYQDFIFGKIHELADARKIDPNSQKAKDAADAIKDAINTMVDKIRELQAAAKKVTTDLSA
jgi:uncharacterized phage infection (PIP) family protein YhgE